jgi:beta-1,4-mannosyltransferase
VKSGRVAVIVLGDLGRSPRMQRHAVALAEHGCDVALIGFGGTPLPADVAAHPRIRVHLLPSFEHRRTLPLPLRLLVMAARQALLALTLFARILALGRTRILLVQNPPAVPAVLVALAVAPLVGARVVVDWHNLTTEMLRLRLADASGRALVRLTTSVVACAERLARHATAHFVVSDALAARAEMPAAVLLRDRSPAAFVVTARDATRVGLADRIVSPTTAVVICPSSWSIDEDTDMLLDVAARWKGAPVVVLLTGLGERRRDFEARAARLRGTLRLVTAWFAPEEFPHVLASADLGLCLHRSASGLDLPIKLAEMRGCCLPVAAIDYGALHEVSDAGTLLFSSGDELLSLFGRLFATFPTTPELDDLRGRLSAQPVVTWEDEWHRLAAPVFERLLA